MTALMLASENGFVPVVQALIKHNAQLDLQNKVSVMVVSDRSV